MADTQSADYVVVGSGVAGALVAHQLVLAGKDVLILEAGPRLSRWEIVERFRNQADKSDNQAPYPSMAHAPHPQYHPDNHYLVQKGEHPYDVQYLRVVGGTTWHWRPRPGASCPATSSSRACTASAATGRSSTRSWSPGTSAPKRPSASGARPTRSWARRAARPTPWRRCRCRGTSSG